MLGGRGSRVRSGFRKRLTVGPSGALSRTFRRLEERGVLEAAPHHVTITDPDSLCALAELIE
jgi:hypothetical protein